ncbi:MAG: FAD-binding protein [Ilumatobacter sp.]|nr:FAD-binding protein [Ilumatobacter sp.]
MAADDIARNWGGNHQFRATRLHRPRTIDDVASLAQQAQHLRVVGSRHSFTDIADSDEVVTLADLDRDVELDEDAGTITVPAQTTYGDVARMLQPHGLALHNMASLPDVSVAGAIATATHGGGATNGNLATSVAGLEIVTTSGEIVHVDRSSIDFDGMVVSLGRLGIVTAVTLDVQFDYEIEQHLFEHLSLDVLASAFEAILSTAYSVSVFTDYGDEGGRVWIKRRTDGRDRSLRPGQVFHEAIAATAEQHPIPGLTPTHCTRQLGVPGPWCDRLPHFRIGARPSDGDEQQSEFFVDLAAGPAALEALRARRADFGPAMMVSEIRAVAADELWLSPQYGRDSAAFHFTWVNDDAAVDAAVRAVEEALAPFAPRPHWGKVFHHDAFSAAAAYVCLDDFADLAHRFDPHGVFVNDWWRRHIGV